MQIHLPRGPRPVVTVFGGVIFGALLAGAGPQLPNLWDRPACAETVMKAVSADRPVRGAYNCFDGSLQDLGRDEGERKQHVDGALGSAFALRQMIGAEHHTAHQLLEPASRVADRT